MPEEVTFTGNVNSVSLNDGKLELDIKIATLVGNINSMISNDEKLTLEIRAEFPARFMKNVEKKSGNS